MFPSKKNVFSIMLFFISFFLAGCNFIKESPQEKKTLSNTVETPDPLLQDNEPNDKTAKHNGNKTHRSEKINNAQEVPDALEEALEKKRKTYDSKKSRAENKAKHSELSNDIEKSDALLNQ